MEWISVNDRLPDERGKYIVAYFPAYFGNPITANGLLIGIDSFLGKTTWARHKYQKVTHWMPLPEVPNSN